MSNDEFKMPWLRIVLSIALVVGAGLISYALNTVSELGSAKVAGLQFDPSDTSYVTAKYAMAFYANLTVPVLLVLLALLSIWWKPIRHALTLSILVAMALIIGKPHTASAYYNKTDYAEPEFILPNESAFWIPDLGDNKSSQANLDSESYLKENKIASKRFNIPHAKLGNSGGFLTWGDYYVPTGRLIIVDRTPYSREWVADGTRGSSKKDDGYHCQSSEGLDITVGLTIGTEVLEQNAPKFLYHFGIKPPAGDRTNPEVIFTSVYYGKSLTDVMDLIVRNKIQSLTCNQLASHTLAEDNIQATKIISDIQKDTIAYLDTVGITLDYIGWADTFTFDPAVQAAINREFTGKIDQRVAEMLGPHISTLQGLAVASAIRDKWDGKFPTSVSLWLTGGLNDILNSIMKPSSMANPPIQSTNK